jgi:hypothetical protein
MCFKLSPWLGKVFPPFSDSIKREGWPSQVQASMRFSTK